jgi:hypothetical protein
VYWGELKLDEYIRLSIADMEKNESIMISAAYSSTYTINAFMFGHGSASPTLADVLMLTGFYISNADDGSLFNWKPEHRVDTHNISGWSVYI